MRKSYIFIVLGIILVILLATLVFLGLRQLSQAGLNSGDSDMACTLDARVCSDGSTVGRNPMNACEFYACPGEAQNDGIYCPQDTKQCNNGTYVTRNPENRCQFDECPNDSDESGAVCTLEVMLCPDGTYVGRDFNNNCEFQACPGI
jgi:hypothetical protein